MTAVIEFNGNVVCNCRPCDVWCSADDRCGNCPLWICFEKAIKENADVVLNIASDYLQTY